MGPGKGEGSQDVSSCVPGTHHWLRCRPLYSPTRPSGRPTCSSTPGWRHTSGRARLAGAFWGPGHRPHPRGGGIRPPRVRQGGVLESPAVEGRCGRLPHKGGGGKAGRGGPGAGEAGRGGGGGGGGDKAPAPPGRLVLWLHGSAGCTRPRRCAVLPPGSDRHLGIQARAGEYRLLGPRHWEESRGPSSGLRRDRAPGRELSRAAWATAASASGSRVPIPEGWGVQVCPSLRERSRSSA